jgi:selenocysteine lyase/cysteine desulfurase
MASHIAPQPIPHGAPGALPLGPAAPPRDEAEAAFVRAHPEYAAAEIDALRAADYARLDALGHVYLDYTGGGLYGESQLRAHMGLLGGGVFGNPHSASPTTAAATELVERARAHVLDYFRASPDEYAVVFTANASAALKLVGEAYPFAPGGRYMLTFDNHNSVNGIREFARARGAATTYLPVLPPDLRVDAAALDGALAATPAGANNLFAYPAQSNFSGVQHPLAWVARAQEAGWDVLLDCAAFAPTNRLDLSSVRPDYVPLSFYKLFGYPTGAGCLIARHAALAKLRRPWFAGGTITIASVQGDGHYLAEGPAAFEDGTVNYLGLPAVEIGLRHLAAIGVERTHARVTALAAWLLAELGGLRHSNGMPLVRIYGPVEMGGRGATVAMNFYDADERIMDFRRIERLANERYISLRTGCFCNPGAGEVANALSAAEMASCFISKERMTFEQFLAVMDGKASGAVRVSLGVASNFADVHSFAAFARSLVDRRAGEI